MSREKRLHPTMDRIFESTKLDPSELADAINVSPQNITNWSKRGISRKGAEEVSKAFGLSIDWILKGDVDSVKASHLDKVHHVISVHPAPCLEDEVVSLALISWEDAADIGAIDAAKWAEYEKIPTPIKHFIAGFALIVLSQNMSPALNPKDLIFIATDVSEIELKDGDFVLIKYKSNAILKQVLLGEHPEDIYLRPYNPEWHDLTLLRLNNDCELIGKVMSKYVSY